MATKPRIKKSKITAHRIETTVGFHTNNTSTITIQEFKCGLDKQVTMTIPDDLSFRHFVEEVRKAAIVRASNLERMASLIRKAAGE